MQKLKPPKITKDYKSFAGVVNYLILVYFIILFCLNLQMLLKPIYSLTRKGRPFIWTKVHQEAFEDIKARLLKPSVLHIPDNKGRFQLFSDSSRFSIIPNLKWYSLINWLCKEKVTTCSSELFNYRIITIRPMCKYKSIETFTWESRF